MPAPLTWTCTMPQSQPPSFVLKGGKNKNSKNPENSWCSRPGNIHLSNWHDLQWSFLTGNFFKVHTYRLHTMHPIITEWIMAKDIDTVAKTQHPVNQSYWQSCLERPSGRHLTFQIHSSFFPHPCASFSFCSMIFFGFYWQALTHSECTFVS